MLMINNKKISHQLIQAFGVSDGSLSFLWHGFYGTVLDHEKGTKGTPFDVTLSPLQTY